MTIKRHGTSEDPHYQISSCHMNAFQNTLVMGGQNHKDLDTSNN